MRLVPWIGVLALLASGCGGPGAVEPSARGTARGGAASEGGEAGRPFESEASFARARRRFVAMRPGAAGRRERLGRLLGHVAARCEGAAFEARIECLEEAAELLDPEDLTPGRLPSAMRPLAERVLADASRRGEEGVALAAHLILSFVTPEQEARAHRKAYERIVGWGEAVRRRLGALERWDRLVRVWSRHAELAPASSVLRQSSAAHVARGRAVREMLASREGQMLFVQRAMRRGQMLPHEMLQRLPFETMAPFLAHGRLQRAREVLSRERAALALGGAPSRQLVALLQAAEGEDSRRAGEALLRLADVYLEAMPRVAWGLCREGLRRGLDRARFAVCLGRIEGRREREAEAAAWFAEALEAAPEDRDLYDEALRSLASFLDRAERAVGQEEDALRLARQAEGWLRRRLRRWPDAPAPLRREDLDYLVGRLAVRLGDVTLARRRFEAASAPQSALRAHALAEWGEMELRAGDSRRARRLLRRALDASAPGRTGERSASRAELLGALGDAWRIEGDAAQADRHYRRALRIWEELASGAQGRARAEAWVRVGVLRDRLGRREEAERAFLAALRASPDARSVYVGVLAHLVAFPRGRTDLALRLYEKARRQVEWDAAWRVYLGLWCWAVAVRDGRQLPARLVRTMRRASGQPGWPGRLASLAAGALTPARLLELAADRGQRAEAHFYGAVRAAAEGDVRGTRALLEAVLSDRMVGFYEHVMAQEWLLGGREASADAS